MKTLTKIMLGVAVISVGANAAHAEKLIFAHGYQPSHATVARGIVPWMDCVTDSTGGDIEFDHYPSGQIVGLQQAIHAANTGLADITLVLPSYESSKVPLNNLTYLPGMGASAVKLAEGYRKMLTNGSAMEREWTDQDLKPLFSNVQLPYQMIVAGDPLDTLDKIKGQKIRAGGATINMSVAAVGGVPVEMSAGDMYVAMQRGTVDATVLPLTSAPSYKLEEVSKSVSFNGFFGGAAPVVVMNLSAYNELSDENRKAIEACSVKIEKDLLTYLEEHTEEVYKEWSDQGIEVFTFSDDVLSELDTKLSQVSDQFVAKLVENGVADAQATFDQLRELSSE